MGEKFFGSSMGNKEHIKQELEDAGINDPSEWREVVNFQPEEKAVVPEKQEHKVEEVKTGEIDNEKWQSRLDQAFQQGDFQLIGTLQRVRPAGFPNAELVRARMHELVTTRLNNWVETLGSVKAVSNVELDEALVAEEFGKLLEQFGNEKGILDQLKSFRRATGYSPSAEAVQQKYRNIFAGKKSYSFDEEELIKDVKSLTGIQPDKATFQEMVDRGDILQAKKFAPIFGAEVTSEMVQQAYEAQFAKNGYLDTYRMREIGEKPNADLVQRCYQKIIEKRGDRWIDSVKSLEQATEVKPTFTEEQMRPVFEEFLQRGWYGQSGYVGIENLVEMTGMRPPADLVGKAALKVIDGGHGYIDQGERIKKGLEHLRKSVGVEFEIPEAEIQERYQKAMADKKPHHVNNLYGALGVRPKIDKEEARLFIVSLMDDTYHNPILELEKVFGVKFKATREEIEAKQDELLGKQSLDGLAKITELTGKECDRDKLESALAQLLQKEATTPPHTRGSYGGNWQKNIKQRLEQFKVVIPEETTRSIYETLVVNETIFSSNIVKVQEVTGMSLPADLAQRAYERILSPDYVTSVSTGQGSSYGYGLSSAFAEIYKASGVRPELSPEKIQQFYRSRLERADFYEIKKIVEVTEIQPSFNQEDISHLYKQWILDGKENYIRSAKEITGIELQLDEETVALVSQQIEAGIEKARSTNYEKEDYREKKLDTYSLEQDLRKVSSLTAATGLKPNAETLQSAYSEILASDPYWATKIEQIVKATGVKPEIPVELVQTKGQQFLEQGALRGFQRLQEYGQFTFTPEIAEQAYAGLLSTSQRYDEYDRRNYYNEDWLERIKRLRELSGIPPTESQLGEIFGHLVKDGRVARRSYSRMSDIVEIFQKELGTNVSESIARDVYRELFVAGNFKEIEEFKKKTGTVPEIPTKIVGERCNDLLQKRDFQTLKSIKTTLGLEALPLSPEIVQAEYTKLVENPKFATYNDKDIETFYALYELTGVRPELSSEQMGMAYRRVMFASYDGNYEKFERVVGVPPTENDLQNRIYNWLVEDYMRKENVTKFMEKYGVTVSPEIANKAAMRRLEKTNLGGFTNTVKSIKLIEEISGAPVRLEAGEVESVAQKILETHKASEYSCSELDDLFVWFEETTGQKPSQRLVDLAYTRTLGQTISYEKTESGDYLKAWDWLKQKYGLPSREAVQSIYLAQLSTK